MFTGMSERSSFCIASSTTGYRITGNLSFTILVESHLHCSLTLFIVCFAGMSERSSLCTTSSTTGYSVTGNLGQSFHLRNQVRSLHLIASYNPAFKKGGILDLGCPSFCPSVHQNKFIEFHQILRMH